MVRSASRSSFLFEHDLFGKPDSTFPDHALAAANSPQGLRRLLLRGDQIALEQAFGDLNGVERRALAQIVGNHPHRQAVLDRRILADAADIGRVFARRRVTRA